MIIFIEEKEWEDHKSSKKPMILVFYQISSNNWRRFFEFINNLSKIYTSFQFFGFLRCFSKKICKKWKIRTFPTTIFRWDCCNRIRIQGEKYVLLENRIMSFSFKIKNIEIKEKNKEEKQRQKPNTAILNFLNII